MFDLKTVPLREIEAAAAAMTAELDRRTQLGLIADSADFAVSCPVLARLSGFGAEVVELRQRVSDLSARLATIQAAVAV